MNFFELLQQWYSNETIRIYPRILTNLMGVLLDILLIWTGVKGGYRSMAVTQTILVRSSLESMNRLIVWKDIRNITWKKGCCKTSTAVGLLHGSHEQSHWQMVKVVANHLSEHDHFTATLSKDKNCWYLPKSGSLRLHLLKEPFPKVVYFQTAENM
jgi:hypothetical protein